VENPEKGLENFSPDTIILASLASNDMLVSTLDKLGYKGEIIRLKEDLLDICPDIYQTCSSKNTFEAYKNIHKNQPAVIVGNGKSINQTNPLLIKNHITFACNGIIYYKDFNPTYYVAVNKEVKVWKDKIDCLTSTKFLSASLYSVFDDAVFFPIKYRANNNMIAEDIYADGLEINRTVAVVMLQLAYFMGCNPVYLIGLDHNYIKPKNPSHSYDNHFNTEYWKQKTFKQIQWDPDAALLDMEKGYFRVRKLYQENQRKIYNATPGGMLDVFPRCNFEQVIEHCKSKIIL